MKEKIRSWKEIKKSRPKTKSIWDKDVTVDDLAKMTNAEKARIFPNDFDSNGMPYGDF